MPPVGAAIGAAGAALATVGASVAAALGGVGIAVSGSTVVSAMTQIASGVALSAISRALAEKPALAGGAGTVLRVQVGEKAAASVILGRCATAGDLVYAGSYSAGDDPNAFYAMVIELSDFPTRLRRVMVNGEWVKLSASSDPTPFRRGRPVVEYRYKGRDFLWIKFFDGSQEAADPGLLHAFGDADSRPWLSDMIGRGGSFAIVTARLNPKVHRGVPECLFELDGMPLYDPRKDSTRPGGSGPQRLAMPATWGGAGDDNNAVIVYNLMLGLRDPVTGDWIWGGREDQRDLPEADWFAAMNVCDELKPGKNGVERQYRCGMEIRFDEDTVPADPIEAALKGCQGQIAETAGVWTMVAGAPGLPVYAFTDDDIIITSPEDFDPFPGLDAAYNGVTATYPDPEEGWQSKDAPRRLSAAYLAQDGGRRQVAALSFPATPFGAQVQRLMQSALKDQRRFRRHVFVLPPEAFALAGLDVVSWTSARNGYEDKLFTLDLLEPAAAGCIAVTLREVDPADYDFGEDDLLAGGDGFVGRPPLQNFSNAFTLETAVVLDAESHSRRPALRLNWNPEARGATGVRYQVRIKDLPEHVPHQGGTDFSDEDLTSADLEVFAGQALEVFEGEGLSISYTAEVSRGTCLITEGVVPLVEYQVRARYLKSGKDGAWSGWMSATAPLVTLGERDLDAELVDRVNTARDKADAAAADAEAALAAASDAVDQVSALAGDTISDLEALLAALGAIDAGDITEARLLGLAALKTGWNADPTFQDWSSGSPTRWTAAGLATYGAAFAGYYGGGIAIDIPSGAYTASLRAASDVTGQMSGADAEAPWLVLYALVTFTAGGADHLTLRAEWKAHGSAAWQRGDMKGLTAPDGSFAQLGLAARPGVQQGIEVLVRRPVGLGANADAVSVVWGKAAAGTGAVDLDMHLIGLRAASEAEIAAGQAAGNLAAAVSTLNTTIAGVSSALAAAQTALTASINAVSANLSVNYLTAADTNSAIAVASTTLSAQVAGMSSNLAVNYYTRVAVDAAVATAVGGVSTTLGATIAGLSAAIADETAYRVSGDSVLAGRVSRVEARNEASIVANGSLGSGDGTGWTLPASFTVVPRGGSNAAQLSAPAPFLFAIAQNGGMQTAVNARVEAKEGDRVSGSFAYASGGPTRDVTLTAFVRWLDATGASLGTASAGTAANVSATSWATQQQTGIGPAPAGTAFAQVELRRAAGGAGIGYATAIDFRKEDAGARARIDSVEVTAVNADRAITSLRTLIAASFGSDSAFVGQTSSAVARVDSLASTWMLRQKAGAAVGTAEAVAFASPGGPALSAFRLTYDNIDLDGRVSARDLAVSDSTNLVPDDQLQDPKVWGVAAGSAEWAHYPATSLYNARSLGELRYVGAGGTGFAVLAGQPFRVNVALDGGTEKLACSLRVRGDGAAYAAFAQLQFFDSAGASLGYSDDIGSRSVATTSSITRQLGPVLIAVPEDAVTARFRFAVARSLTSSAYVRFLAPMVRRQSGAVEIADGAITAPKINVTDLAAISATLGTVLITSSLNFADGVVVTGALGANAVSDVGASVRDTLLTIASQDTWTTICSYSVSVVPGTSVEVGCAVQLDRTALWTVGGAYPMDAKHEYRLLRGSTVLWQGTRESFYYQGWYETKSGVRESVVDSPATSTGTRTYQLQIRTSEPDTTQYLYNQLTSSGMQLVFFTADPGAVNRTARVGYAHLTVKAFKR